MSRACACWAALDACARAAAKGADAFRRAEEAINEGAHRVALAQVNLLSPVPKPGQIITVAGNYRQYDQAREKTASGLRWENIGEIRPIAMPELECEQLAAALKDKTRFSRAEWAEFGIEETLTYRHYIQSGPVFFKPVEGDDASNASNDHGETQPVRSSPSPSCVQVTRTGARQAMIRRARQTRQNEGHNLPTNTRKMISSAAESKGTERVHQATDRMQASHRLTGPYLVPVTRRSAPPPIQPALLGRAWSNPHR